MRTLGPLYGPTYYDDYRTPVRDRSLFWAQIVLGFLLIAWILPSAVSFVSWQGKMDAAREALVPTYTEPQYVAFMNKVYDDVQKPAGTIDDYLTTLNEIDQIDDVVNKFMRYAAHGPITAPMHVLQPMVAKHDLMEKYVARYGDTVMHDALANHSGTTLSPFGEPKPIASDAGERFLWGLIFSLFVAPFFFIARVIARGMNWVVELDKILLYTLAWPVMVFRYPTEVDLVAQTKRAMARMGWVLTAFLSIGSAGGALAKANQRTVYESDCSDTANTYVLDSLPEIHIPNVTLILGIESNKLIGNGKNVQRNPVAFQDAIVSWGDGWSFDYGSTESFGLNTSDERDYTLKKVWSLSGGKSFIAGFGYYDIQPVASTEGGDVADPFVEYDTPLGSFLTGYVRGDAYHITGGANGRDGFLAQLGLRESGIKLPLGFELTGKASVLYEKGPFHAEPGLWARGDLGLSHGILSSRAKLGVNVTGFVPLSAIPGATADHSVQLTLTVPLH